MITVVGMGRSCGDVTMAGAEAIKKAQVVVAKSALTHMVESLANLRDDVIYCDDLYEVATDFDHLNQLIIDRLNSFGNKRVVFCVVGDGSDDSAAQLLTDVKVIHGVSLGAKVVGSNTPSATVTFTAQDLLCATHLRAQPTIVKCIDDKYLASEVQLKLQTAFDNDTVVTFCSGKQVKTITLDALCKQRYDYQTCILVTPKKLADRQVFNYYDCVDVMDVLRGENGCPWDKEQTHKSIIKNVIEEAYELADALQKEDVPHVIEELGDLLMQVIFHLAIALDEGEFEPIEVYTALCRKLVDRHPHVFGEVEANNSIESLNVWEQQKKKEHKIHSLAENVLDVPRSMSALMRTQKVQSRASKGGYEFASVHQITQKVKEELTEFLTAPAEQKAMEGGDLLFAVVNLLRFEGMDAETSIMLATEKFVARVVECERLLALRGQALTNLDEEQFDEIWNEAKSNVG